jgi:hypothetical protein
LRWPPSPMSRPSSPPTDPRSGTAFPPRGPLGEFPRFTGTTRCSDSPPPFRPHFVAFAWPYRAWARCSLPGEGSPPAWVLGLVTRWPDRDACAETTGPPRFLGIPRTRMPPSRTPVESRCLAIRGTAMQPSAVVTTSASTVFSTLGALSRGLRTPCVRFAAPVARPPRNTRFRLVASLCRAGLATRRDAAEGFRVHGPCISSPLSRLRLAQHNFR